ncbi:STAS/SEC14 domain-containing protein [Tropicimonas sp. IMCC34043]|uniref:STAS/SEC14 domain-containing protein n=1 Tax=Tropicimonas sp. IMCC34043 TaxID=2248760 RepID=UPI0018E585F8|nr:STAS/SEC14 domain-containing protein [Tropicimonas sp. IMCC34043]
MIEVTSPIGADLLEIAISGEVSDADYKQVLIPAIDAALEQHDRIRLLGRIDPSFSGYSLRAMADDAVMGLRHWRGFDRIAVVGDASWITAAVSGLSILMPCPVKVFPLSEQDAAKRWLQESLGAIHQTDLGGGVLHVELLGQIDPEVYAEETEDLNAFLRANDRFALLLDLRNFDGWQGLAGIAEHLKLVRDHIGQLDRIAIVAASSWQKLAARVGAGIAGDKAKVFAPDHMEAAEAWLRN